MVERFPCSERPNRPATALRLSGMQSRGDSWESSGWEAEGDPDRAELLELARRLAEQHRRQSADALAEVEDLKRALRERAADVARRELEVERRTKELDAQEEHGRRALRLRRSDRPQLPDEDRAYAEELLNRREADVRKRLDTLIPRERELKERETELRARELQLDDAEAALERRKQEVERSHARLGERERELKESRAELDAVRAELAQRAAALEAAQQELDDRRKGLEGETRTLEEREGELEASEAESAADAARRPTGLEGDLVRQSRELAAREAELTAREAELVRLQTGLAAQQETIRARERALDDEERLRQREAALPAHPYVSFTEGLDAFTGGRRSR
jgi:chromosome segregation ATPase